MINTAGELFQFPLADANKIREELIKTLPPTIVDEIDRHINALTMAKFQQIDLYIGKRFNAIDGFYNSISINKEYTDEERREIIKKFFTLTYPKSLTDDLHSALHFREIKTNYNKFIENMSKNEFGDIFRRYNFDIDVFNFFTHGLLGNIDTTLNALEDYSKKVVEYYQLVDNIHRSKTGKSIFKAIATGVGLLSSIPFLGMAARSLIGDDKKRLEKTLDDIEEKLENYRKQLRHFLNDLEQRYSLLLYTIYGGTLLRVNEHFHSNNIEFNSMNLSSLQYTLKLVKEEEINAKQWAQRAVENIKSLLEKDLLHEARIVSNRFFQVIENNSPLKTVVLENKSIMYLSNLYKYATLSRIALEIKKQDKKKFLDIVSELFKQMPYVINDKDLAGVKAIPPVELLMQFIYTSNNITTNLVDIWKPVLDYYERMIIRVEKGANEIHPGEIDQDDSKIDPPLLQLILFMANFLYAKYKYKHELITRFNSNYPPNKILKILQAEYIKISGNKDDFYKHFNQAKAINRLGIGLGSVLAVIMWPIAVLLKLFTGKSKKYGLALSIMGILFLVYYFNQSAIQGLISKINMEEKQQTETAVAEVKQEYKLVTISVDRANVRTKPDLNSNVAYVAERNDKFFVLTDLKTENDQLWYNVCPTDSWNGQGCEVENELWISSVVTNDHTDNLVTQPEESSPNELVSDARDKEDEENKLMEEIKQKSRISVEMKDRDGNIHEVSIFSNNEESYIANFDDGTVTAGASPGDTVYYGDYQFAVQSTDKNSMNISTQPFRFSYNENYERDQVFIVRANGMPDILVIGNVETSNDNMAHFFQLKDGKLEAIRLIWEDQSESTYMFISSFYHESGSTYVQRNYDNLSGNNLENIWSFDPDAGVFELIGNRIVSQ
ncbi:hypothetical protein P9265_16710 [Schinkia azotoformans]|uniref:hypothetical protein n=1 Tax=Schinkia azotoformans TaxID=1454 RepID=UPI002E220FBE|nr:hypothetical protein [Schinkia azotoformans]